MSSSRFGKIGVIMGGVSSEREISLKSGNAVFNALLKKNFDVLPIDLNSDKKNEVSKLLSLSAIDTAFIALHGYFGEDGKIQSILEESGISFTGSDSRSSWLAMDKIASRKIFEANGLNVPRYQVVHTARDLEKIKLDYPLVVKPSTNGSSIGLSIIDSRKNLKEAFDLASKYDQNILIEEYIKGRELTVGILGDESLPVIEIIPKNKFFDFEAKYQKGLTDYIVPAQISEQHSRLAQEAGLKSFKSLGCSGFSRVDMILRDDKIYVLELNSIPGMTETSLLPKAAKCQGLNFEDLCEKILELTFLKKERIPHASQKK